MILEDWSNCPSCKFPALFSPFKKYISVEKVCPMCEQSIDPNNIVKEENPVPILKKLLETTQAPDGSK